MKRLGGFFACAFLLGLAFWSGPVAAAVPEEAKVSLLPPNPEVEATLAKALKDCPPVDGKKIRAGINKNGTYTLVGDLFGDGKIAAVIDLHEAVALCTWEKGRWKPTGILNENTDWKYPGWDPEGQRTPQANKPFWMLVLDKHPLLVIASIEEKNGQNYSVFLFDASHRRIADIEDSFSTAPTIEDGYLITQDDSRNKAEWSATSFSRIKNDKFVERTTWEEWCPYNQPSFLEEGVAQYWSVTTDSRTYTVMDDYSKSDHPADLVIFDGELTDKSWRGILDAWKTQKVWAKVYLKPRQTKKATQPDLLDPSGAVDPYLFEKLTGLPRRLCPHLDEKAKKIEATMKIEVRGNKEAVKLLSFRHSQ